VTTAARATTDGTARAGGTQLAAFRRLCEATTGRDLGAAAALHDFSTSEYRRFWRLFLDWSELVWDGSAEVVCTSDDVERAAFFPGVRLSYAENLLRPLPGTDDDSPAVTSVHGDGRREEYTRGELRAAVGRTATALATVGVGAGDRVAVIAPNAASALTTALAVAAVGGALSSGMPDMGPSTLLGRFEQVEPVVLVLDRGGQDGWAGDPGDTLDRLLHGLPGVATLVVLDDGRLPARAGVRTVRLADLLAETAEREPVPWPRLPFDHPLFVMFSSGTTGPPKAMVHGAGGTLLEHVKEHRLHGDLRPDDVLYFHTTTAWMMWNWQLSALAVGACVVLYDGPVLGPETLWRIVAEERVTVFGTSPTYLQLCQDADHRPADLHDLSRLRAVLSTGAVLHDWQFDWVAEAVGPQPLQSISGGTDLIGCFVLGHPELPVQRGRCQTRSLGLDVAVFDAEGRAVVGEVGDLVCRRPFPSRPTGFLRDPTGARMHDAYFDDHPGVWTHGDLIEIAEDGSARMHGRSDGVLNIDGVRIGPSEIYRVLRGVPEVADSMAVEQRDPAAAGQARLVLLVVLRDGALLDAALEQRIRATLRRQASAAHVPAIVVAVDELPVTHNGKRSERAARDALDGRPAPNRSALRNPGALAGITAALAAATAGTAAATAGATAPTDRTTAVVTRIWREHLGPAAGYEGTFSDLGGSSRQAMTVLRQVRSELGRDVAMADFLAEPTLGGLLAAARRTTAPDGTPAVVRLAAGDPLLPPLLFVNDAWGDVDVYWAAAQLLTSTGPVYGLRLDLQHAGGRRATIDELAAAGAEQVAAQAPEGPVRLAGHSFGGLVAFEVARRLRQGGRTVDFLGLVDVLPPTAGLRPPERLLCAVANRLAVVLPGLTDQSLRESLAARFRPASLPRDRQLLLESEGVYNAHRPVGTRAR
jgi:acetoacetyl-CoA synthetase